MVQLITNQELYDKYRKPLDKLFSSYSREVGWIVWSKDLVNEIGKKKVVIGAYLKDDEVVGGFYLYIRKDNTCKISAIAVKKGEVQSGIGKEMIDYIKSLYSKMEVACLADIPANQFYQKYFRFYGTKLTRLNNTVNIYRNYAN